jgi:transposase
MDTLRLVLEAKGVPACTPERAGARELLEPLLPWHSWLKKPWADGGYSGKNFEQWVRELRPGLEAEIVKRSDDRKGFEVLSKRWIVERTFGWLSRCRRVVHDYETAESSDIAFIYLPSYASCSADSRNHWQEINFQKDSKTERYGVNVILLTMINRERIIKDEFSGMCSAFNLKIAQINEDDFVLIGLGFVLLIWLDRDAFWAKYVRLNQSVFRFIDVCTFVGDRRGWDRGWDVRPPSAGDENLEMRLRRQCSACAYNLQKYAADILRGETAWLSEAEYQPTKPSKELAEKLKELSEEQECL